MKAIVLRKPGTPTEVLMLETVRDPSPGPREIVVKVKACGVCSHDIAKRNGILKAGITMPLIPGHEVSGYVAAVGRDVHHFHLGDRVATTQRSHICGQCVHCRTGFEPLCDSAVFMGDIGLNGGYAEYVTIGEDNIALVPEAIDLEAASVVACAIGTTFHAITRIGRLRLGETLLVTGATGGLGIHALQIAKSAGARVIAQTSSVRKRSLLQSLGVDAVVVGSASEDFSSQVKEATKGVGVNMVIDTVGTPLFTATRRSIAKGGRWVLVGQINGEFASFSPAQLFLRGISMLSATSTTREELEQCLDLVKRGLVRPLIDRVLPLDQAAEAHHAVESANCSGRILLRP